MTNTHIFLDADTRCALSRDIESCLLRHQPRLQKRLAQLAGQTQRRKENAKKLAALRDEISRSQADRAQRVANLPQPQFPEALPVSGRREEIAEAIAQNQVIIVAGETGSGKTTQIPKICLALGRGTGGLIGHTQPRRIAARTVAQRIAEELGSSLGEQVGFKVRFSDHMQPGAYIKLMTDGILLAELAHDRDLLQYDTLIIDEAHERSLNIDFLLGYFKQLLPRRPDFKLIITSATIDTGRFSRHFDNAPVIEVSGRTYPVELRYRPLLDDGDENGADPVAAILRAVDELAESEGPGDTLVFLSGEKEIRDTTEALRKHHPSHTEILPLYSRLSAQEQNRVFQPGRGRRIVLATNVAETSLTVPGIRFVVDPGKARISRYSYRTKVQRLPIEAISQSSASQRSGRCGRVSAGVCIRLYAEEDFIARPVFTEPEIQRTNLASVILQMRNLGLGDPEAFPFIDPPDRRYISDGFRLLQELGAIDEHRALTVLGEKLSHLPLDPKIGRMILAAEDNDCLAEVLIIASALSVQDPRERPSDKQQQADEKHAVLRDEKSDFMSLLTLWQHSREQQKQLSKNQWRKYCRQNFLSFMRMKDWADTHQQLRSQVKNMGLHINTHAANYEQIHCALLSGLLSHVGTRDEPEEKTPSQKKTTGETAPAKRKKTNRYLGARNTEFFLFPGSGLAKKSPRWVMSAELVQTSRLFARQNASVEPEWIESAAHHLLKREYSEPYWDKRCGRVSAFETVRLYGLVLHARRRINFSPIDPLQARQIFIREALVNGEYRTQATFFAHNQKTLADARELEDQARSSGIVVDDEQLFQFFDEKIPDAICSHASFEKWRKQAEHENQNVLRLSTDDVLVSGKHNNKCDYPAELDVGGVTLPLSYCFNPGGSDDGVTVTVPLGALNQLNETAFEWLVPGLLAEKITALLKSLPKNIRKQLVPVPDTAEAIGEALMLNGGSLLDAIGEQLLARHITVNRQDWRLETIPEHLKMRFRIVDQTQKEVGNGRELGVLQARLGSHAVADIENNAGDHRWPTEGVLTWDFGVLPEFIEQAGEGSRYRAYPALTDKGDSVGISLQDSATAAERVHRQGLLRLATIHFARELKYLKRHLPDIKTLCLQYASLGQCETLKEDLVRSILDRCFFTPGYDIRDGETFASRMQQYKPQLMNTANDTVALCANILQRQHDIRKQLQSNNVIAPELRADIEQQLTQLIFPGFLTDTAGEWLSHLPRFLRAIQLRLEKQVSSPASDDEKYQHLKPLLLSVAELAEKITIKRGGSAEGLQQLRWMLEEYRVSLFAQELKTSMPISPKRIEKQINNCRKFA
ncbi:MAG: ATP-dependent RNA helicase HrpA [Gammaproteobacteria bacterium]|nr:ATP-dependent RNA helicase HrpA [Gammaproteobacteria bacterium]